MKLLIEDRKLLAEKYARRARLKKRKIFELYRRHFEKLRAADLMPPVSPTVMTFALVAAANSVYQWYDRKGEMSIDDIARQLGHIFIGPEVFMGPEVGPQAEARKRPNVR